MERIKTVINRWWKIAAIGTVVLALIFVGIGIGFYGWGWTGFRALKVDVAPGQEYFRGKTLWDVLQLLIVPIILAGGALFFNRQARQSERALSKDRLHEESLQNYLDKMSDLLLEDPDLKNSQLEAVVRDVARARTLTALRGLDGERKGLLLRFLYEADLINKKNVIVNLHGADLREASLREANLREANLREASLERANLWIADLRRADLRKAILERANLRDADLRKAILEEADLRKAILEEADLRKAILGGANLRGANLRYADLEEASLWGADLEEAILEEAILEEADLEGANLEGANLEGAFLERANLWIADLRRADLRKAFLEGANLRDADLEKAIYDENTKWPDDFDVENSGAIRK